MKFSSPTHTQNAQFPTIFSVLGRYFFHTGTPHDHTVLRRGDISVMQPPGSTPAWRTPEEPSAPRDAEPGCGARRRWRGLAGQRVDAPSHTSATRRHRCGGRRRDRRAWPRCRWVAAGPGRASRSTTPSRRLACGDLAGGPPPTGTHSGPAPKQHNGAPGTPAVPHSDNMQRQRRAGGPPPTGAPSSPARRVRPDGARNTSGAASTTGARAKRPYSPPPPGSGRPV